MNLFGKISSELVISNQAAKSQRSLGSQQIMKHFLTSITAIRLGAMHAGN